MMINSTDNRSAARPHGLLYFLTELRRRRVCRAATMYAVAMWLICQIVELVYLELGLPGWTLKFVIVIGLLGLPIALILSWILDITPDGLVLERRPDASPAPSTRRPADRVIDCSLVFLALIIGVQLATGVLFADTNSRTRIAVIPFRVATGTEADALSQALLTSLQHELRIETGHEVIVPIEPYAESECFTLTGSVSMSGSQVYVTATMIDNRDRVVTWSAVFTHVRRDDSEITAEIARDIVVALPAPVRLSSSSEAGDAIG